MEVAQRVLVTILTDSLLNIRGKNSFLAPLVTNVLDTDS